MGNMTAEKAFASFVADLKEQLKEELRAELLAEMPVAPDRTLLFSEALDYLKMSEYTLRKLCREKRIPHRMYGAEGSKNPRYLFSTSRLDTWIREQEEKNYLPRADEGG